MVRAHAVVVYNACGSARFSLPHHVAPRIVPSRSPIESTEKRLSPLLDSNLRPIRITAEIPSNAFCLDELGLLSHQKPLRMQCRMLFRRAAQPAGCETHVPKGAVHARACTVQEDFGAKTSRRSIHDRTCIPVYLHCHLRDKRASLTSHAYLCDLVCTFTEGADFVGTVHGPLGVFPAHKPGATKSASAIIDWKRHHRER